MLLNFIQQQSTNMNIIKDHIAAMKIHSAILSSSLFLNEETQSASGEIHWINRPGANTKCTKMTEWVRKYGRGVELSWLASVETRKKNVKYKFIMWN